MMLSTLQITCSDGARPICSHFSYCSVIDNVVEETEQLAELSDISIYLQSTEYLKVSMFLILAMTSLPYFRVKLSCVCLMFAYRKT